MSPIKSISYFACGYCQNEQAHLFKGLPKEIITFPAGVFLIEHERLGYILYDTGYDAGVTGPNLKYWLYRLPNPITMTADQQIDHQLQARGISADEIAYVIISHLHPDHIGRLKAFPKAQFLMTETCYQTYQKPGLKDLVFKEYFPEDFEQRLTCLKFEEASSLLPGRKARDLFGDNSLVGFSIDGHAKGQLCLYLPDCSLFIAADLVWQLDMLVMIRDMKAIPRFIQEDFQAYQTGASLLQELQQKGLGVLVCHDKSQRIKEILDEKFTLS